MVNIEKDEINLLRELARRVSEIAAHPIQEKRRRQWEASNGLHPQRPMVWIDQVCWHEMDVDGSLTLKTRNPVCRNYEDILRKILYRHKYMQADQVVEPFLEVPITLRDYWTGFVDWQDSFNFGIGIQEETSHTDSLNDIVGHKYIVQIEDEDDIGKIVPPRISYDQEKTEADLNFVRELFADTIAVRPRGCHPAFKLWDSLVQWCGMENLLVNMAIEPEFLHKLATHLTNAYLSGLDQLEALGVLGGSDSLIHCTGAYSAELPLNTDASPVPNAVKARDMWTLNLCQIFSSTSKDMHREFESTYSRQWFKRFGLGYYGCCEPLHDRVDMIREIPNIRKISMSPWADYAVGAEAIGSDYVFSCKPNPNIFARDTFDVDIPRKELENIINICDKNGTPLEIIQKDLSTVHYQPQRLWEWSRMAAEITGGDIIQ